MISKHSQTHETDHTSRKLVPKGNRSRVTFSKARFRDNSRFMEIWLFGNLGFPSHLRSEDDDGLMQYGWISDQKQSGI